MRNNLPILLGGLCAGAVNGLLGAGGGMVLVPLLTAYAILDKDSVFPSSVVIITPICIVSLLYSLSTTSISFREVLPYLIGSAAGGILAGVFGKKIPTLWLHRVLGILILWGGLRILC